MTTSKSSIASIFRGWLAPLVCASLLAACGGGGGSPGSNSNGVAPSKASSVVLIASASTIPSSGEDGSEVTLTAVVKDGNNNVLPNETVDFKASSGSITTTTKISDANGAVVGKLSVKGDSSLRDITVTASAGGATSNAVKVSVQAAVPTVTLTNSGTLSSSGAAGSEVTLTVLVKDSSNTAVPNAKVTLSASSGSLGAGTRLTDANGKLTEKLGTGNDPTSRDIIVKATVEGAAATTTVNVKGTVLSINASSTVNAGASSDVTVKLVDSSGNALSGRAVAYNAGKNQLSVKGGGLANTNSAGQLILTYTATTGGSDIISVSALGETATTAITVNNANFYVRAIDGAGALKTVGDVGVCHAVTMHSDTAGANQDGTVSLSTSRGNMFTNSTCTSLVTGPLPLSGGSASAYVMATGPGVATLGATTNANGATAQGVFEFVAPLTPTAVVLLQADPAVVGANTTGSTTNQSTLRAIVLDGTSLNNPVKNARVTFSIQADPSGGTLTQPSEVFTGSDGSASVSYIAGNTATAIDGVVIQAGLSGASTAKAQVHLTVAQKSLFISAGTGNSVAAPTTATYRVDYAVVVSDAAGNAVPGVKVTGSVLPRYYYKGVMAFLGADGPWQPINKVQCANEDTDGNGLFSVSEDVNGNGRLDPGIPVTVTPASVTDAAGQATVSLLYPQDRAYWVDVDLTIRAQVSGSEARYVGFVTLPGQAAAYGDKKIQPPGFTSPYGVGITCSDKN